MTPAKRTGVKRDRTPLEIVVLILSLLGILSIVGGLAWYGVTSDGSQAELSADINGPTDESEIGKIYEVTVSNDGGTTAEEVVVEVVAGDTTREIQFRAIAKGDQEKATVVLPAESQDPRAEIIGYKEP